MELYYSPDLAFEKRQYNLQKDAGNAWEFFMNGLINFLTFERNYCKYFEEIQNRKKLPNIDKDEVVKKVFNLFKEKRIGATSTLGVPKLYTSIWKFYEQERSQLKIENSKAEKYKNFLDEIEFELNIFIFLSCGLRYKNQVINFEAYAFSKLGQGFMDLKNLEYNLSRVFFKLDNLYFREWVEKRHFSKHEVKVILNKEFDFEQYASPIIFIEYPKELAIYKRLLKNWLLMEIEKRKREFMSNLKEFPKIYSIITDFADRLLDPTEQDFLTIQTPEYYQYPNYIFKGFKGYKLFEEYAQNMVSQTQLTFLYRYMKETERDDFKIIADPAVFLDWFDNQKYSSSVYEIKNSLSKVKTKERVHNYELTKKLINKLYAGA